MYFGVYKPVPALLTLEHPLFSSFPVKANIQSIEQYAGASCGTAVVTYASEPADDATRQMKCKGRIDIGGTTVFRGVVVRGPFQLTPDSDEVQLVLICDKWRLRGRRIGQYGIGTQGTPAGIEGFCDVGFELIFNREGRPNKDPASLEFDTGFDAVYWTLKDIMLFLFLYYVPSSVATVPSGALDRAPYARIPSHLTLLGQTACQAIEAVAELAGESWTLIPGKTSSEFRCVYPGAGTTRTVKLFAARKGGMVSAANEAYATETNVPLTIENCIDKYQARSALIVKETTYTNIGSDPLLKRASAFKHKKYVARFEVDVAKYEANDLGKNLSAGSTPKAWLTNLLTRVATDGSQFLTAVQLAADPTLLKNKQADICVWLSLDGTEANAKLCTGGFATDVKHGTLDFEAEIDVRKEKGTQSDKVVVKDWSVVGIWLTVATVLELPEIAESIPAAYLDDSACELIDKPDLVPERRQNSWLPNLTSWNPHAIIKILPDDPEEKYVDITARLTEAVASAIARSPAVETPIDLTMDFYPVWNIGDKIAIVGRKTGATGSEVIVQLSYAVHESFTTKLQASNVMKAVDPEKFVQRRKQ